MWYKIFVILVSGMFLLMMGCVSITSVNPIERQEALLKITEEEELVNVIINNPYEDVRIAASKRLTREPMLKKVIRECGVLPEEIQFELVSKIQDQKFLKDIVLDANSSERLMLHAMSGIVDEMYMGEIALMTHSDKVRDYSIQHVSDKKTLKTIVSKKDMPVASKKMSVLKMCDDSEYLCALITNKEVEVEVRQLGVENLADEACCRQLMKIEPRLEEWVMTNLVTKITNQQELKNMFLITNYPTRVRKIMGMRIADEQELQMAYQWGSDELIAEMVLPRLSDTFLSRTNIQQKTLQYFRMANSGTLMCSLMMKLDDEIGFERESDQIRIAKSIVANDTKECREKCRKILFDDVAILKLALEDERENESLALWALDLQPTEKCLVEIAIRAKHISVQNHAVMGINDESMLCMVAEKGTRGITRASAIDKMTSRSESVISKLTEDSDLVVATAAVKKLKKIGSQLAGGIEKEVELRRQKEIASEKKVIDRMKHELASAEFEFKNNCRRIRGLYQYENLIEYITLKKRWDIKSRMMVVSGWVRNVTIDKGCFELDIPKNGVVLKVEVSQGNEVLKKLQLGLFVSARGVVSKEGDKVTNGIIIGIEKE